MRDEILDHYDDQDIRNIYIKRDVSKWQKHLAAIKEESEFFQHLIEAVKVGVVLDEPKKHDLITRFVKVDRANDQYMDNLIDYRNQTDSINECQDMQCEKFFLNSHEEFTQNIEAHLDNFRSLKAEVRQYFSGRIDIVLE